MAFFIIGLLIIIYGVYDYKKAFFTYLIYKVFLVTNISIVSLPGIPMLSLDLFMVISFYILFFCKRKNLVEECTPFPLNKAFKLLAFSWLISSVFAYVGFGSAMTQFIREVFTNLILVWLIWKNLTDKRDIKYLLKGLTIAFFITCIYGFYEHSILDNPLANYEMTLVKDQSRALNFMYDADYGRGYRVKSVFEHPIGAGANWALYIMFFYVLLLIYRIRMNRIFTYWGIVVSIMSLICMFYSNSRSPFLFLLIGSFSFINIRNKSTYGLLLIIGIAFYICLSIFSEQASLLSSIFNVSKQNDIEGSSSIDMRLDQLDAAIALMMQSPIWGFGYKFTSALNNSLVYRLLGLESIWFQALTTFGLLGVVANGYLAYVSIFKISKHFKSKSMFFVSLAYWILISSTSVPGMLVYLYYLLIIIVMKLNKPQLYTRNAQHISHRNSSI